MWLVLGWTARDEGEMGRRDVMGLGLGLGGILAALLETGEKAMVLTGVSCKSRRLALACTAGRRRIACCGLEDRELFLTSMFTYFLLASAKVKSSSNSNAE